jgi:hypothetical protein
MCPTIENREQRSFSGAETFKEWIFKILEMCIGQWVSQLLAG